MRGWKIKRGTWRRGIEKESVSHLCLKEIGDFGGLREGNEVIIVGFQC